ncbi:hypothetical protein ONS95_011478 [Cadophora gregata]|uniref:uncharacterized protein n=1 Tax=Cadophora gregata TaxID=51156 RepID=UPI0026DABE88|nr:uncharacterized protein ONS95_011478 [Cadophora gregata]KAK0120065.1 hypothetical protein ONS95_011478 [Cadophora gregata]KAK0121097.1 hypothetical protein ONS96_011279 [Cadophora gregata f. sp. sojae]
MDSQGVFTAVFVPRKRRRHSMGSAPIPNIQLSINTARPTHSTCPACLNLDWSSFGKEREFNHNPYERQLTVSFCEVISSAKSGCQTCNLLEDAVIQFSKPLLKLDVGLFEDLVNCELMVKLRYGYSVIVDVMEDSETVEGEYFSIEIYRTEDHAENSQLVAPARDVIAELDIDSVVKFIESKSRVCAQQHKHWQVDVTPLPTRILHIRKESDELRIKLLETNGMSGRYMALSHCWGPGGAPLKTTTSTIQSHFAGIELAMLPKTFSDAVRITEAVGISYLWIDSLCIIQDDQHDWGIEAAKMHDVYSRAYITLAATGSSSSLGGCLFPRKHVTYFGKSIMHKDSRLLSAGAELPDGVGVRYETRSHQQIMGDSLLTYSGGVPLLTRAWVLQERFFSPVFLHFHEEELVWECHEGISCECGYFDWERLISGNTRQNKTLSLKANFRRISQSLGSVKTTQDAYDFWLDFTKSFTCLNITVASDQLPAVMGIAARLSRTLPGFYLLGIWSGDLARGLLWRKFPYQKGTRVEVPQDCHCPTWTWASVSVNSAKKHGFGYPWWDANPPFEVDPHFTARCNGLDDDILIFGPQCKLQIGGDCIFCTLEHRSPADYRTASHILHFEDEEAFMYADINCKIEKYGPIMGKCSSRTVCCLFVGSRLEKEQWVLVVEQISSGEYERIGVAEVDSTKDWFRDAEVKQIVLI